MAKKALEKILKKLWHELVFTYWGDKCVVCDARATHPHHYIPKSKSNLLRFEIRNGVPLCAKDHYLIHFSHNPEQQREICDIIRDRRGTDWCNFIDTHKHKKCKYNTFFLEDCLQKLNELKFKIDRRK